MSALTLMSASASAQVSMTATAGATGPTTYATLKLAFDDINAGLPQGAITIDITANTTEGTTPATLNSSGAGPALYTSVLIRPTADGVSISGNPITGFGVIQLKGADNVTIDGDNPGSPGINRDLTVANTTTTTVIANSVIRIATSVAVTSADNNTIKNCILTGNVTSGNAAAITLATSSSNSSFGIYAGGNGGLTATDTPTAITSVTTNSAPAGTTINALLIDNNSVSACARAIVFNGAAATVSTGVTITNNVIGDQGTPTPAIPPYTFPATTVYTKGIWLNGANAVTVTGNTLKNIMSYIATTITTVELVAAIGPTVSINNNTITNPTKNGAASAVKGIQISSASGTYTVSGNIISNVQSMAGASGTAGIDVGGTATSGTVELNKVTTVHNRSTGTFGAWGISVAAGTAITVRNNFISDVNMDMTGGLAFSTTFGIVGLRIGGGTGHRVYHNSVNLSGALFGAPATAVLTTAFSINATGQTGVDVRNNAFSNTMTGGTTSIAHVSIFLPAGGTSAMNLTLNNNGYYFGTDVARQGVGQAGTVAGTNFFTSLALLKAYSGTLSVAGTNDNASFASTSAAPFTSATDLHIPAATLTQLESSGAAVGVTTDIDAQLRNATTPDIGADEFAGIPVDLSPPSISYAPLGNTTSTVNRTIVATITDGTGVPTAGALQPRLYLSKNAGAYSSSQCLLTSGSGTNGTWDCPLDHSLVGGVVAGDVVSYFVIAQDTAAPNIASNPAGVVATDVNSVTTPPASPSTYTIAVPFPSSVNVGSAETITSLTNPGGLFALINGGVLTGNVAANLTSDLASETGTVALNQWVEEAGSGYTLTIKPTGAASTISGTSLTGNTGLIRLNGADRVTIDGSLTVGGTDRSLTITNANLSGVVIWISSASAANGANNNTVKNCILSGSAGIIPIAGVLAGGSGFGTAANAPNSDNTIQNNQIFRVQNALFLSGNAASLDQNWLVTGNAFGSAVPADKLTFRGMLIGNAQNFVVSRNTIGGVVSTAASTSTVTGIQVSASLNGGSIYQNQIGDIKQINTGGWGSNGIFLAAATTASNVSVYNNFVYDVASFGFAGVGFADNGYGIMIATGGGYKLYHNSVHLNTDQTSASGITAAVNIASAVITAGSIDLRDNILASSQTLGTRYGVYDGSNAGVFSSIDYNDYFAQNVGFLTSAQATLANWQTATGQDANSKAIDPLFTTPTDLHLQATSPVIMGGTFLASVTTDLDNDPRSTSAPDMGADEVIPAPVDVSITKTHAGSPAPGQALVYTVTALAGPRAATAAVVDTFPLPCSFTAVATGGATGFSASGANINDAAVTLPAGSTVVYTATCSIPASATGLLSNTATVTASGATDFNPANNSATDAYTLVPTADLSVTLIDAPEPVVGLGNLIYIVTTANAGPSDASLVHVVHTLDAGTTFSSLTASGWTCTTGVGTVTCDRASLAAGANAAFYVQVTVGPASTTLSSTAVVSAGSSDTNLLNNSATETTTVNGVPYADLSLALTDGGVTSVLWGGSLTYTITVTNIGPDPVTGATVSDSFPTGLSGITWVCGASGGSSCALAGVGNINDTAVNLALGGTATYTATGIVNYGTASPLANTATVGATIYDPVNTNNSVTINTTVDVDLIFKDGFE